MANKFLETYNGLDDWAKSLIAVGTFAIIGGTIYIIYRNKQNAKKQAEDLAQLLVTKKDADDLIKSGMKPTYNETEYNTMANTLFTAMNGYGTDINKIFAIISKMKNDLDIHYLILAYGSRKLSTGKLNPVKDVEQGLASAFADELGYSFGAIIDKIPGYEKCTDLSNFSQYKEIDVINCILDANKIKFKF